MPSFNNQDFQPENFQVKKIPVAGEDMDFTPSLAMAPSPKSSTKPKQNFDWPKASGELIADVFQTDQEFFVQSAIAGIDPANLDIVVENKMLVIKGNREMPLRPNKIKNIIQECHWGSFTRQISLPENIDTRSINASLKKGILTIQIPLLAPAEKKVSIKIQQN